MALHILNLGAGWRWVINITLRSQYPREESRYPLSRRLEWTPGPVRTGVLKIKCPQWGSNRERSTVGL